MALSRSVLREACRPTHRREVDVSPVRFEARGVPLWSGQRFHRIAPNLLGETRIVTIDDTHRAVTPLGAVPWAGRDQEHWSWK